jgi:hypothetical protein
MAIDTEALERARLRLEFASWIQLAGAIPPTLLLLFYLYQPEEPGRMPGWLCAPIALVTSFPLRRANPWAYWLSLLLTPFYPLAPYLDLTHIRGSLHGGEVIFILAMPVGAIVSVVLIVLLLMGRRGVRPF